MFNRRPQHRAEHHLISYIKEHGPDCPGCQYSLKGLDDNSLCPECGADFDRDRLAPATVHSAVDRSTTWCGLGALGWIAFAYLWWLMHIIRIPAPMYEERLDLGEHLDDLASTAAIFAFAVCLIILRFKSIKIMHTHAIRTSQTRLRVPRRILLVAIPGIISGSLSMLLLLMLMMVS